MNYIQYGQEFFHGNSSRWGTNGLFMNGQVNQVIALFGNELAADTMTFVVNSKALVGDGTGYAFLLDSDMKPLKTSDGKFLVARQIYTDWRDFTPGAPLDLYNNPNGTMIGRFYVEEVTQVNRKAVRFTCTDCVGILASMDAHGGGVYTGETVSKICAEIFAGSGLTYAVGNDVGAVQCYGRLPRDNRRTNLGRLLVATGATLMEKNGVVQIVYLGTGTTSTMYKRNIYMGNGNVVQKDPATAVTVTEHAFYQLADDKVETLFDNTGEITAAVDQLVVFSEACHDLEVTGTLTISESNANYAIVSGVGTLVGSVYTHTRRQITKATGVTTYKEHVEAIEDNELIGYHNSEYVAQRMANWYAVRTSVEFDALDPAGDLLPGSPVNFTDPFGTARTGWIHKKDYAIGNKTRAMWEIPVNWKPGPWGSNIDAYELITASGTWIVPPGVDSFTVVLGGGGEGGQAGFDGTDGGDGVLSGDTTAGEGGDVGAGGNAGKVYQITIPVSEGDIVTVNIGAAGEGGAENGAEGSAGGATTITVNGVTYTSESGTIPERGFTNQFTGDTYALPAPAGDYKGADGGVINQNRWWDGSDLVAGDVTYKGGKNGTTRTWYYSDPGYKWICAGGGGAGAAYGNNGANGGDGTATSSTHKGGNGAKGADALPPTFTPLLGGGGKGGNGGGGGGGGGAVDRPSGSTSNNYTLGKGGAGGKGSRGCDGGQGWCLFLFRGAA